MAKKDRRRAVLHSLDAMKSAVIRLRAHADCYRRESQPDAAKRIEAEADHLEVMIERLGEIYMGMR